MAYNRGFEVIDEQVADYLKSAVDRVKTSENVDTLTELNKLFKKNVPLTVRKYVIAFMLKESLKHYHSYSKERNVRQERDRNERTERPSRSKSVREHKDFHSEKKSEQIQEKSPVEGNAASEEHPRHPRVIIPESEATSIFISIGKNRRVYPRDLVGVLIAIAGIDRDRIGDIKVLANYSFVQLYADDAQIVIDKLNGYDYRGRKLVVSYSRQNTEESEEAESSEGVNAAGFGADSITEQEMAAEDAAAYAAAEKAAADKEPFGV